MPTIETKYAIGDIVYSYDPIGDVYAFDYITEIHIVKEGSDEIKTTYRCGLAGTVPENRVAFTLDELYEQIKIDFDSDTQKRLDRLNRIAVLQYKTATDTPDTPPAFEVIGALGDLITTTPSGK